MKRTIRRLRPPSIRNSLARTAPTVRCYRCQGLNLTQVSAGHYEIRGYEIKRELRMWEIYDVDGYHVGTDFTLTEACAYIARFLSLTGGPTHEPDRA